MSFSFNEQYNTVYATSTFCLIDGLNTLFDLGLDINKSFFGSMFNIHLTFKDGSSKYFYNRDDLLEWVKSVVKTSEVVHENYIGRYDSRLKLDADFVKENRKEIINDIPEVVFEDEVDNTPEQDVVEFEDIPKEFETDIVINDDFVIEIETTEEVQESPSEQREELNWKSMTGPKWSKQEIADKALEFGITLDISKKKQEMIADFQTQYNPN